MENLEMGAFLRNNREENQANLKKSLLVFHVWKNVKPGSPTLSGGEQQMLAMGRALMSQPKLCSLMNHQWAWLRSLSKKF